MTLVYLDGAFLPSGEALVPATGEGALFGRGVFETMRARGGRVFRFDAHLDRMERGARFLEMPEPDASAIGDAIVELTRRLAIEDARVRVTLLAGAAAVDGEAASLLIQARPATDYPPKLYERGISATVAAVRRNEASPLSRLKTVNCLDNVLAREAARAKGAQESILVNARGLVAEGSASNVFAVVATEVVTPPIEDGALPGVTRAAVLELARDAGMGAGERSLTLREVESASEAFVTNAVMGVMPLVSVGGAPIGEGRPGEVTRAMMRLYAAAVDGACQSEAM